MNKILYESMSFANGQGVDVWLVSNILGKETQLVFVAKKTNVAEAYFSLYDFINNVNGFTIPLDEYSDNNISQPLCEKSYEYSATKPTLGEKIDEYGIY